MDIHLWKTQHRLNFVLALFLFGLLLIIFDQMFINNRQDTELRQIKSQLYMMQQ